MSCSSDSEEFFDAEEDILSKSRKQKLSSSLTPSKSEIDFQSLKSDNKDGSRPPVRIPSSSNLSTSNDAVALERLQASRNRLRELRYRMQTEDEEPLTIAGNSPTGSPTSSLDGVFPELDTRSSHPFRIIEHDALSLHSLTSLGRIGRTSSTTQEQVPAPPNSRESTVSNSLSGSTSTIKSQSGSKDDNLDCSEIVKPQEVINLQEPDVIASTKAGNVALSNIQINAIATTSVAPVAPPRRKRKNKSQNPPNSLPLQREDTPKLMKSISADEPNYMKNTLPSPSTTIESLTREFEHSLDISSAVKGLYVVKPQDDLAETKESEPVKCRVSRGSRNSSTYPLGGAVAVNSPRVERERRKSAGDEKSLLKQVTKPPSESATAANNMFVRTRTDSGKPLSDLEILEQVTVLNLDTGERVPLSIAEDKLPQCINPLSLHIMRLTSEYVSNTSLEKEKESDEESVDSKKSNFPGGVGNQPGPVKRKTQQLKKFLGTTVKRTMIKQGLPFVNSSMDCKKSRFIKTIKFICNHQVHSREIQRSITEAKTIGRQGKEDGLEIVNDQQQPPSGEQYIKLKASNSHKGPYDFDCLQHVQDLSSEHVGPVWCMKFSSCGRLLATAGQDRVLRIWVVASAYSYFREMRAKYESKKDSEKVSPSPSQESLVSQTEADLGSPTDQALPFMPKPFCTYSGHTSDLLDISWSKNYFVLSSSMDKTVRLWHISRRECLCCFQHIEFVTAIAFHPRDDRYFLSGSLDGKIRLWNIPDKKVAVWSEVDGQTKLITAANFCQNGKFAVVGSYDGRCIFYITDQLKYHTQIHVRSTRGKNATGRKISGIEPMPGEDKILVTSNDSRIRLYDLRDLNLSCKYKGYVNMSSQIKASFSHDGKYIVSGSENQCIYIWKSNHDYSKFTSVRRDRNDYWEGIKVHNAVVTCAVFSPNPNVIIKQMEEPEGSSTAGYVLVSADFNGGIKVFINKTKPKHSSLPASAMA